MAGAYFAAGGNGANALAPPTCTKVCLKRVVWRDEVPPRRFLLVAGVAAQPPLQRPNKDSVGGLPAPRPPAEAFQTVSKSKGAFDAQCGTSERSPGAATKDSGIWLLERRCGAIGRYHCRRRDGR